MYQNVMIIDDLELNCQLARQIILRSDFATQVSCFNSGQAALQHLGSAGQFPDIIFLDLHMPGMDGFAFAESYRQQYENAGKQCKIVMLSSSSSMSDLARLKDYPVIDGFMSKPLTRLHLDQLMELQEPYAPYEA